MGQVTFGVPKDLVVALRAWTGIRVFVETGTNRGGTARWASGQFDRVYTIEGYEPLHREVSSQPDRPSNVEYLLGDSRVQLPRIVEKLQEPAVFWLDAHWCGEQTFGASGECPVVEEIETVNRANPDHVVLVDDARLFLTPPPAPHRAEDWPDLARLCSVLSTAARPRNVVVYNDVLIGAPLSLQARLTEFLRARELERLADEDAKRRRSVRGVVRRLLKG